jgi:hypothetical protein
MAFNVSNDFEMAAPKKGTAFMMPTIEWGYLRKKINELPEPSVSYREWGFFALGISVTAMIEVVKDPKSPLFDTVSGVSLVSGLLCFAFSRTKNESKARQVADIIDYLGHIDERFNEYASQARARLKIVSATYFFQNHKCDVTENVRRLVAQDSAEILSGNHLGGDPCPGQQKSLTIVYTFDGATKTCVIPESETKRIP